VSCDDVSEHILSARAYQPPAGGQGVGCVGASAAVDIVSGAGGGDNCAPTCLRTGSPDASFTYITTVCPPYPGDYSAESQDAATNAADPCAGAFGAYAVYLADGSICVGGIDGGPGAGDAGGAQGGDAGGLDGGAGE
jgi:hypothetical protein